jgi:RNA polymerase sigma-70 factor, ECF subfamily
MKLPSVRPATAHDASRYSELIAVQDETLMARLVDRCPDALAVLFDRYHRLVLGVAFRILRDSSEAEDLMQSVFLEIFRSAANFNPSKGTVKVWILQYAYHRSFNRRQYLSLRGMYERAEAVVTVAEEVTDGRGGRLDSLDSSRFVQQALGRLNQRQRTILELAFYDGLTMREIAERTGGSFDSVRHQYYRGLEKLRSILCGSRHDDMKVTARREELPNV